MALHGRKVSKKGAVKGSKKGSKRAKSHRTGHLDENTDHAAEKKKKAAMDKIERSGFGG